MQTTHRQRRGADNKYHINIWHITHHTTHHTSHITWHTHTHTHTKHPSIIHAVVLNQVLWNSMIHSPLPCPPRLGVRGARDPDVRRDTQASFPFKLRLQYWYWLLTACNDATALLKIPKHRSCILSVIRNNHNGRLCSKINCQSRGVSPNTALKI